jgi:GH25 family lysozyme M1 (1,4-beta-N-acetylmuramidase)
MRGIDVSSHQGKIDWKTVKSSGIEFAIIRAGYGESTIDKCFEYNITEALKVGLKVGVYWFCYALNEAEAIKEADFCFARTKAYPLSFPIFYDFEYDTERYANDNKVTYTKTSRVSVIKAFCDRIKELGRDSGIYTNLDYIKHRLNFNDLKAYPLWLAVYGNNEEQTEYGEILKQTTSSGKVNGIVGNTDMNVCFIKETTSEPNEWSKEAVEWAVKNKILQGDENGDLKLNEPCTTERFITILHRALKNIKIDIGD